CPALSLEGLLRPFYLGPAERLIHRRILIPQRPRNQPRHRVQNHRRRQLPARQHEIPHRNLIRRQMLRHALVHSLVAPADQHHPPPPAPPPPPPPPAQTTPPPPDTPPPPPPPARPAPPKSPSTASNSGSGFITIPSPPPNGRSSTVRCRSCVNARKSCACVSI